MGDIIPSSSDEEGCMVMMRVGNKGCQVFHALNWYRSCGAEWGTAISKTGSYLPRALMHVRLMSILI
jgi:hypothetical protein